MLQQDMLLL